LYDKPTLRKLSLNPRSPKSPIWDSLKKTPTYFKLQKGEREGKDKKMKRLKSSIYIFI